MDYGSFRTKNPIQPLIPLLQLGAVAEKRRYG